MDPQATWDQLLSALAEGDWDQIEELATALLDWLDRDGFSPTAIGTPNVGPEFERAICRAGCEFALDVLNRRWTVNPLDLSIQEPQENRP